MPSSTTSRLAAGNVRRARSITSSTPRPAAWRLRCSRTACSNSPRAWPRPKAKAARLVSTDLPACRIAASKAVSGMGSRPEPASAPSSTALMTPPDSSAAWSMSNRICALLRSLTARSRRPTSKLPSPIAMRSPMASTRCVEAISVVRSGVTKPLKIMRPASSSSVASATSTSPIAGLSASTDEDCPRTGMTSR